MNTFLIFQLLLCIKMMIDFSDQTDIITAGDISNGVLLLRDYVVRAKDCEIEKPISKTTIIKKVLDYYCTLCVGKKYTDSINELTASKELTSETLYDIISWFSLGKFQYDKGKGLHKICSGAGVFDVSEQNSGLEKIYRKLKVRIPNCEKIQRVREESILIPRSCATKKHANEIQFRIGVELYSPEEEMTFMMAKHCYKESTTLTCSENFFGAQIRTKGTKIINPDQSLINFGESSRRKIGKVSRNIGSTEFKCKWLSKEIQTYETETCMDINVEFDMGLLGYINPFDSQSIAKPPEGSTRAPQTIFMTTEYIIMQPIDFKPGCATELMGTDTCIFEARESTKMVRGTIICPKLKINVNVNSDSIKLSCNMRTVVRTAEGNLISIIRIGKNLETILDVIANKPAVPDRYIFKLKGANGVTGDITSAKINYINELSFERVSDSLDLLRKSICHEEYMIKAIVSHLKMSFPTLYVQVVMNRNDLLGHYENGKLWVSECENLNFLVDSISWNETRGFLFNVDGTDESLCIEETPLSLRHCSHKVTPVIKPYLEIDENVVLWYNNITRRVQIIDHSEDPLGEPINFRMSFSPIESEEIKAKQKTQNNWMISLSKVHNSMLRIAEAENIRIDNLDTGTSESKISDFKEELTTWLEKATSSDLKKVGLAILSIIALVVLVIITFWIINLIIWLFGLCSLKDCLVRRKYKRVNEEDKESLISKFTSNNKRTEREEKVKNGKQKGEEVSVVKSKIRKPTSLKNLIRDEMA